MEYGRLGKTEPTSNSSSNSPSHSFDTDLNPIPKKQSKLKILLLLAVAAVLLTSSVAAAAVVAVRSRNGGDDAGGATFHIRRPSQALATACGRTRFPNLCVESLVNFPGAAAASGKDLLHISVNVTLQKFDRALYSVAEISNVAMDPHVRSVQFSISISVAVSISISVSILHNVSSFWTIIFVDFAGRRTRIASSC